MTRWSWILSLSLLVMSCAAPFPEPRAAAGPAERIAVQDGITVIHRDESPENVRAIARGVNRALEACSPWGVVESPVRVLVYGSVAEFHAAIGRDYPWLRAWATERDVALLSPSAWAPGERRGLERLVTHEFVHVLHYQAAGIPASRTTRDDPFWFREGLASNLAREGGARLSTARCLRGLRGREEIDLLDPSRDALRRHSQLLYSAAHHFVAWLRSQRPEGVTEVMRALRAGRSFREALVAAFGASAETLLSQWRTLSDSGGNEADAAPSLVAAPRGLRWNQEASR